MVTHVVWFIVILLGAGGVVGSLHVSQAALPTGERSGQLRAAAITVAAAAVALVALSVLWRAHALARADGRVVKRLAGDRGSTLNGVFSVVTTMGDVVPCFTIATVLSILIYRRIRSWTVVILPVLVLVQVGIQIAFLNGIHSVTIAQVEPHVLLGGAGGIPSGSVARLLSIFLVAALMWRRHDLTVAHRLVDLGAVLVFVELVSRLYLGRHLLADIVGGLLLGIVLTVAAGWLLHFVAPTVSGDPRPRSVER